MHILHEIAQEKQRPIIVVTGADHTRHVVKRLQQCGYTLKRPIGENLKTILTVGSRLPRRTFPSALDLETVFNNLEPTKGEYYYVQKVENFFQHPWTKRICLLVYLLFLVVGILIARWLKKHYRLWIVILVYYLVLIMGNMTLLHWLLN